jgi:magnesium chelatase family protein
MQARQTQLKRANKANSRLNNQELEAHCCLAENDVLLLDNAIEKLGLSARAYHRILRVARTIADLEEATGIQTHHLTEALSYRKLDRKTETIMG